MRAQPASRASATGGRDVEHVDRAIAQLATAQDGVVSRWQLISLGLSRRAIGHRLATGRLHAIHRGWGAHGHRGAFERDRMRDAMLEARGYAVMRFTWRQVKDETARAVVAIAQVLALRSHSTTAARPASP